MDFILTNKKRNHENKSDSIRNVRRMNNYASRVNSSPDRFLSSIFVDPSNNQQNKFEKSNTNIDLPSRLPQWLCTFIATTLGAGINKQGYNWIIATGLHVLTLLSGLCFTACGLYFNVYDALSTFTKTTVLVSVSRSVIGLYWILLGIYSHSLAARLVSNPRVVDCIRLHCKTFIKINMVIVIAILTTTVIVLNIYTNSYLLDSSPPNKTEVYNANCGSIGAKIVLCRAYFASKVVYACFSLVWNLMVAAICLSICRTLTIGIRRFMRELNYDAHIYEEHLMLHNSEFYPRTVSIGNTNNVDSTWTIWDDDIKEFEEDDMVFLLPSSRQNILKNMRKLRHTSECSLEASVNARNHRRASLQHNPEKLLDYVHEQQVINIQDLPEDYSGLSEARPYQIDVNEDGQIDEELKNYLENDKRNAGPPIISNQDLLFTYFKLMRRLTSTSRLLQRWFSCWITFVALWCAMLIIYWTSKSATLIGLTEFLLPVLTIGLMSSAYAEVNFEGERLLKSILPTEHRMPVIYYFQNARLELKIFSFVMSYNVLVTVFAGVAVTFASRIIIDQIG